MPSQVFAQDLLCWETFHDSLPNWLAIEFQFLLAHNHLDHFPHTSAKNPLEFLLHFPLDLFRHNLTFHIFVVVIPPKFCQGELTVIIKKPCFNFTVEGFFFDAMKVEVVANLSIKQKLPSFQQSAFRDFPLESFPPPPFHF